MKKDKKVQNEKSKTYISNKSMMDNSEELIEIKNGKKKVISKIQSRKSEIKNEMER